MDEQKKKLLGGVAILLFIIYIAGGIIYAVVSSWRHGPSFGDSDAPVRECAPKQTC